MERLGALFSNTLLLDAWTEHLDERIKVHTRVLTTSNDLTEIHRAQGKVQELNDLKRLKKDYEYYKGING